MNNKGFYEQSYEDISPRNYEWRELSGKNKADNIMSIVGQREICSVLDIGAGTGAILNYLSKNKFAQKYYAVDISEEAIKIIRNRGDITNLMEAQVYDGFHLPYPDRTFDVAILSHIVEHLNEPASLLKEAARVAKYIVIEVPLENNLYTHIKVDLLKSHYMEDIGHVQRFTRHSLTNLIEIICGLKTLSARMVYIPDEVYFFYKGKQAGIIARFFLSVKKTLRFISPYIYSLLLTDHYIMLVTRPTYSENYQL